jgi:hypothetical protein
MNDNKKSNRLGLELTILAAGMRIRIGLTDGDVRIEPCEAPGLEGGCRPC